MTKAVELAQVASLGVSEAFKNRIINGNMSIDQRNAGASTTAIGYNLDRWSYYSNQSGKLSFQKSTDAPTGFYNSVLVTSTSAFSIGASDRFIYSQVIEGFNTSDIAYGTAAALTTTLSFWVKSSLTGTFACSLNNGTGAYSYVTTYSIPVANTWTKISLTIAGSTAGAWNNGTNGGSIYVNFDLGSGSTFTTSTLNTWQNAFYENATGAVALPANNGATWYVTGCQLEVGSSATGFEYRQLTNELNLCQRYFQKTYNLGTKPGATGGYAGGIYAGAIYNGKGTTAGVNDVNITWQYKTSMRTNPTITFYSPASGTAGLFTAGSTDNTAAINGPIIGENNSLAYGTASAGGSTNDCYFHITASAEL